MYGYNPQADTVTFKLIIDHNMNQDIEFNYDDKDWIKEMVICRGTLSLKEMLANDKNSYFWVKMEESRVSEISIASSFERIFKREDVYLLGQIGLK